MTIHKPAPGSAIHISRSGSNVHRSNRWDNVPVSDKGDHYAPLSQNAFDYTTFWAPGEPGLHRLSHDLTIQGTTVQPKFLFVGHDATATGWAPRGGTAPALTIAGAGSLPTTGAASPFFRDTGHENVVRFNDGQYYQSSDTTYDLTTGDVVWEIVFQMDFIKANAGFGSKRGGTPTNGWDFIAVSSLSALRWNLFVGGTGVNIQIGGFGANQWEHVMLFCNRDKATTDGARMFRNGVNIAGTNASSVSADASSTPNFYLGTHSFDPSGLEGSRSQAWCAMWEQAAWFDGVTDVTDWTAIAQQRARRVFGTWPSFARGTANPIINSRASGAYVDHDAYPAHGRRLFSIGNHAMRSNSFKDSSGVRRSGYPIEEQTTNLCPDSISTVNAASGNTVITSNNVVFLNGIVEADLVTESTDGAPATHKCEHSRATAVITGADTVQYCISLFIKASARTQFQLSPDVTTNINFDLDVDLSAETANVTIGDKGGIIKYGTMAGTNNWYRIWVTATQSGAGSWNPQIVLKSGGSNSYQGDGSNACYICGWQVEATGLPTSWVRTSGATATRIKDALRYKGDDGNLSGVGSDLRGTVRCNAYWPGGDHPATGTSGDGCIISISDGGSINDRIQIFHNRQDGVGGGAGGYAANFPASLSDGDHHDIQHTWSNANLSVETRETGTELVDSTTATIPNDLDHIEIGGTMNSTTSGNALVGNIRIDNVDRTQD